MEAPSNLAPAPAGRVAFLDGMRISKEHLEHLQAYLHLATMQLRESVGEGKVVHGLKVKATATGITVGPGLAFDGFGRPLALDTAQDLVPLFAGADVLYAVLAHDLRYGQFFKGFPTVITDHVKLELRTVPPPYADGAVRFAEIRSAAPETTSPIIVATLSRLDAHATTPAATAISLSDAPVILSDGPITPALPTAASPFLIAQSGRWYLPPLDHGHSGRFYDDAQSRMRYDGDPMGLAGAMYDSGFINVAPGDSLHIRHGLMGRDFLAQLEARTQLGVITNRGAGREYWYELPADGEAVITRTKHKENLLFRLRLWPLGAPGAAPHGPIPPIANAGSDKTVEVGKSFQLNGSLSRSPSGIPLRKFKWTQLS